MTLPKWYKSVFGIGLETIGVVVNNKVQFYEYDDYDEEWAVNSDYDFILN